MILPRPLAGLAALCLAACQGTTDVPGVARLAEPGPIGTTKAGPPEAAPGSCWGKDVTPALIETVTEQVRLPPAGTGTGGQLRAPAIYQTETRQEILRERRELWFETPCAAEMDAEFTASLQRALKVRGLYRGPVTGRMDGPTRAAVRRYQAPRGLDSGLLSLAAARQLGLAAYGREEG